MNGRKDYIPLNIKKEIWSKFMHPSDNRIAQCYTCNNFVRHPEAIRHCFGNSLYVSNYPSNNKNIENHRHITIIGCGQYGHRKSEHNGGLVSTKNLVIQCSNCNLRLGVNNITNSMKADVLMVDASLFVNVDEGHLFYESDYTCSKNTACGKKCKNKCIYGEKYCHLHIHN